MKRSKHNPYGYKLCYREPGEIPYRRYFKTYTYRQAMKAKQSFLQYPPRDRGNNHRVLFAVEWVIIPIRHSEIKDGIWLEDPF